ncbi:MAG: tetratricopeptide repeat protein [Bdellovibrionales bacterium]|nr:tetratricopeptide repeat protein [Bdellovibrionales bacterium]
MRSKGQSSGSVSVRSKQKVERRRALSPIEEASLLIDKGNYEEASIKIYNLLKTEENEDKKIQLKYILGLALFEMKLYQSAAFQFVDIVRHGKSQYVRKSLSQLSVAASFLNDDSMLNYALSQVKLDEFPRLHQDMLYFRIGEVQRRKGEFLEAAKNFRKVNPSSTWFSKARYNEGLSYSQGGKTNEALNAFNELFDSRSNLPVTDPVRVAARMGIARVYYQMQNWEASIESYRQIPKDTDLWHDSLFEISWAHLRAAQFRSVLSQLHSLHSPFYEDHFNPESVLLRSIVYLYICKYDEMEKTLDFFDRVYRGLQKDVQTVISSGKEPQFIFDEIVRTYENMNELRRSSAKRAKFLVPFIVARHVAKEGDFLGLYEYLQRLNDERRLIASAPARWRQSGLGQSAERGIQNRIESARQTGGEIVLTHLKRVLGDFEQQFEQHGFARYEMLRGRKESIKKQIAAKGVEQQTVDQDNTRSFYVKNGFEYWPFKGEYWRDEIGNTHYLGTQSCE